MFEGDGNSPAYSRAFLSEDVAAIDVGFSAAIKTLSALPDALTEALQDEKQYETLVILVGQISTLDDAIETGLKNTDLYLGFNSLDGD